MNRIRIEFLKDGKAIKSFDRSVHEKAEAAHEEEPEDDFFARTRALDELPKILEGRLERVVLVHKLREVVAQIGFTRFEAGC